jgi:hypothetical protein
MKRWLGKLSVGTALALVGVLAIAGGALSLLLRDSSQASTEQSASTDRGGPPWLGGHHFRDRPSSKEIKDRRRQFHEDLAKELGVSTEKVEQAFRNLFKKRLDRAVKDGNLTRKQADQILNCYDNPGKCKSPFGDRDRFRGPPGGGPHMGGPGFGPPGGGP